MTLNGLNDIEKVCVYSNICNSLRLHACIILGPPDSAVEIVKWSQREAYTIAELGPVSLFDLENSFLRAPLHASEFLAVDVSSFVRKFEESDDAYQFLPRHCDEAVVFAL